MDDPIYEGVGGTVGILQSQQPGEEKGQAYACDVTYGTNSEFGFDYLRDNMAQTLEDKVQHGGRVDDEGRTSRAIRSRSSDEVDNILIDEARTPLISLAPRSRQPSSTSSSRGSRRR